MSDQKNSPKLTRLIKHSWLNKQFHTAEMLRVSEFPECTAAWINDVVTVTGLSSKLRVYWGKKLLVDSEDVFPNLKCHHKSKISVIYYIAVILKGIS